MNNNEKNQSQRETAVSNLITRRQFLTRLSLAAGGLGAGAGGAAGGPGVEDAACDLAAVRDQDLRDLVRRHLAAATLCYNAAKSFARRGSQSESETTAHLSCSRD